MIIGWLLYTARGPCGGNFTGQSVQFLGLLCLFPCLLKLHEVDLGCLVWCFVGCLVWCLVWCFVGCLVWCLVWCSVWCLVWCFGGCSVWCFVGCLKFSLTGERRWYGVMNFMDCVFSVQPC